MLDLHLIASGTAFGGGKEALESFRASLMEQRGIIVKQSEIISDKTDILKLIEL